ncbi:hypothetical protein H0H87_001333 [Tephrocybe sp. NHM501043]|nr:hypothetical protein H0H87_001333 [Tephrocybe sp. NHM501043]
MSISSTKILDHIVHLTPPGSVEQASNQFRQLGFTYGVYLELISFTHPPSYYPPGSPDRKARDSHRWSSKPLGWIDFAFLGNGALTGDNRISDIINERAKKEGSGVAYAPELAGGRQRPDGKVLKWVISAPSVASQGPLPFFCGDVTPREWRVCGSSCLNSLFINSFNSIKVPSEPPSNINHPSTAHGILHVLLLTSSETFDSLLRQFTSVVGSPPISSTDSEVAWQLEAINERGNGPQLILKVDQSEREADFVQEVGTGIFEVAFSTESREGSADTPYGKIVWTPAP